MTAQLKALGPLGIPGKFEAWDREVTELAHRAGAEDEVDELAAPVGAPAEPLSAAKREVANV